MGEKTFGMVCTANLVKQVDVLCVFLPELHIVVIVHLVRLILFAFWLII